MKTVLPPHVYRKTAKGRAYFYFVMHTDADGKSDLRRLPDIGLPQFQHEYETALAERQGQSPPEWQRPDRSYVYFIGGEVGAIKIGWARSPQRRLSGIQTGSPIPLAILATVEGGMKLEREYHRRFAAYRLSGEWFERCSEILAEIERINAFTPFRRSGDGVGR